MLSYNEIEDAILHLEAAKKLISQTQRLEVFLSDDDIFDNSRELGQASLDFAKQEYEFSISYVKKIIK